MSKIKTPRSYRNPSLLEIKNISRITNNIFIEGYKIVWGLKKYFHVGVAEKTNNKEDYLAKENDIFIKQSPQLAVRSKVFIKMEQTENGRRRADKVARFLQEVYHLQKLHKINPAQFLEILDTNVTKDDRYTIALQDNYEQKFYISPYYDPFLYPSLEAIILESEKYPDYQNYTLDELVELISSLMKILKSLDKAKVIHRDIKPGNLIMLSKTSVMLIDFGISLSTDTPEQLKTTSTNDEGNLGTVGFVPPELRKVFYTTFKSLLIQQSESYNRFDIYGMGMCLYMLITKNNPYVNPTSEVENPYGEIQTLNLDYQLLEHFILKTITKIGTNGYVSYQQLEKDWKIIKTYYKTHQKFKQLWHGLIENKGIDEINKVEDNVDSVNNVKDKVDVQTHNTNTEKNTVNSQPNTPPYTLTTNTTTPNLTNKQLHKLKKLLDHNWDFPIPTTLQEKITNTKIKTTKFERKLKKILKYRKNTTLYNKISPFILEFVKVYQNTNQEIKKVISIKTVNMI